MNVTWPPGIGGVLALIALILIVIFWAIGKLLAVPILAGILVLLALSRLL
jgi:hypothetical protein